MAENQSQMAIAMLCKEQWDAEPEGYSRVEFHKDGTGFVCHTQLALTLCNFLTIIEAPLQK
jgi:hypothetical protein